MKDKQSTNTILMVPPLDFRFNEETALTNAFQSKLETDNKAMEEFNAMVDILGKKGVEVLLLNPTYGLPDSVFPNNWFSTHSESGYRSLVLYPLFTANRQLEVQEKNLINLLHSHGIQYDCLLDLRPNAKGALEGTGSLVLDRQNKIAFAALSYRTDKQMVVQFCQSFHYQPFIFEVIKPITVYHTNIMMHVGEGLAVVCLEAMRNKKQQREIYDLLTPTHEIIPITFTQLTQMCGNIIFLESDNHEKLLIMSKTAYQAYSPHQLERLSHYGQIVPIAIPYIEKVGGGGVRCMIAEIF